MTRGDSNPPLRPRPTERRAARGVGMRREAALFLPLAGLVLVGLTVVILLIHRGAVRDLRDERREHALRAVDRLLSELEAGGPIETTLRRHTLGGAVALAVLDPAGRPLWTAGPVPDGYLLTPLGEEPLDATAAARVLGPDRSSGGAVVVIAPVTVGGRPAVLRRDEPARRLASLVSALPALTGTVLGACVALTVLLGLYLRRLVRPFEQLLDRARQVEATGDGEDDIARILSSFDRALEALRERDREGGELAVLERTLTHMDSGLLLLDPEGRFLALNESGAELLAIATPVEGRPLDDVLDDQPELRDRLLDALTRGHPIHRAEIPVGVRGAERIVGLTLNPLRRDDQRISGWLGLFADLTEARRLARNQQLGESLRRIGELTAGLAHELRNGLATLRGYLTLIEREELARPPPATGELDREVVRGDALADYLQEMRREVDDLHRIAEDFLEFARPGSIRLEPLQPERLARRAAADPGLGGAHIAVEISPSATELAVEGDPHLLGRALRNLLDNAVRAHRQAGVEDPVRLIVEGDEHELELRVVDRGPGLDPEMRERLFVPFASGRDGAGLGLAIAQRIAQLHGGVVEIREPDRGGVEAAIILPAGGVATAGNDGGSMPADADGAAG